MEYEYDSDENRVRTNIKSKDSSGGYEKEHNNEWETRELYIPEGLIYMTVEYERID